MTNAGRKSKAKIKRTSLLTPNPVPSALVDRDEWIESAAAGFVTKGSSYRSIYRVILETLWPKGHGIPGPIVDREEIRRAVDLSKGKPYHDPFRRVRELQGDEGFRGITQQGTQYQLIDLTIYPKKQPRTHLSDGLWTKVVTHYNGVCAVCGGVADEEGFQQDHKVPRDRGGTDVLTNWQPLCESCNNAKSVACRGCTKDCSKCGWAYPEHYKPIVIPGSLIRLLREYADSKGLDVEQLVSDWLMERLNTEE